MITKSLILALTFTVVAFLTIDFTVAENSLKTPVKSTRNLTTMISVSSNSRLNHIVESPKNSFSMWLTRVWDWVTTSAGSNIYESRTFGQIRRLKNALIPIMFKFGVISTLITVLVFLALKSIFLLKVLLIINAGAIFAKLLSFKTSSGGHDHHHYVTPAIWQPNNWQPPQTPPHWHHGGTAYNNHSPLSTLNQGKEIHVHIHNSLPDIKSNHYDPAGLITTKNGGWESEPYGGYSEVRKQYSVSPEQQQQLQLQPQLQAQAQVQVQPQYQQQQHLVKISGDDLNYLNSRRYGRNMKQ